MCVAMVQFRNEIVIQASPEAVFDEMSDLRNEMRWQPKMRSVELLSEEPISVGSRLRARWAGSPINDVVYCEYERPVRWRTEYSSPLMRVDVLLEVTPTTTGSRLTSTWDMQPRGPLRLLSPLLQRVFNQTVADSMRSAKRHVEQLTSS